MYLMTTYVRLSTNRQLGYGGVGPIPSQVIWNFCDRERLTEQQAEYLEAVVVLVDQETLRRQRAPAAAPSDKKRRGK